VEEGLGKRFNWEFDKGKPRLSSGLEKNSARREKAFAAGEEG